MNWWHRTKLKARAMWYDFQYFTVRAKQKSLNKGILLWWYKLYIRKDEFHRSLDRDIDAMVVMTKEEQVAYISDLYKRRWIAHQRGLVGQ